jgi:hypothetical protein
MNLKPTMVALLSFAIFKTSFGVAMLPPLQIKS